MFCKKCGKELKEGAEFCLECGHIVGKPVEEKKVEVVTPVQPTVVAPAQPAVATPAFSLDKIFDLAYVVIGALAIVFAIICFAMEVNADTCAWVSKLSYGGDAYTGIQNAGAATANNINILNDSINILVANVKTCFGFVFLLVGLLFVVKGLKKVLAKKGN